MQYLFVDINPSTDRQMSGEGWIVYNTSTGNVFFNQIDESLPFSGEGGNPSQPSEPVEVQLPSNMVIQNDFSELPDMRSLNDFQLLHEIKTNEVWGLDLSIKRDFYGNMNVEEWDYSEFEYIPFDTFRIARIYRIPEGMNQYNGKYLYYFSTKMYNELNGWGKDFVHFSVFNSNGDRLFDSESSRYTNTSYTYGYGDSTDAKYLIVSFPCFQQTENLEFPQDLYDAITFGYSNSRSYTAEMKNFKHETELKLNGGSLEEGEMLSTSLWDNINADYFNENGFTNETLLGENYGYNGEDEYCVRKIDYPDGILKVSDGWNWQEARFLGWNFSTNQWYDISGCFEWIDSIGAYKMTKHPADYFGEEIPNDWDAWWRTFFLGESKRHFVGNKRDLSSLEQYDLKIYDLNNTINQLQEQINQLMNNE